MEDNRDKLIPAQLAASITAVFVFSSKRYVASTLSKNGPFTETVSFFAFIEWLKHSTVPSPPSAIGTQMQSTFSQILSALDFIISETSILLIVDLNESGIMIIFLISFIIITEKILSYAIKKVKQLTLI